MKKNFLIKACLGGMLFLFLNFQISEKEIIGHWIVIKNDPYGLQKGDTLILEKRKQTDKMYEWGGIASGYEFLKDGTFYEYHNVLCSTESSPIYHMDEKWRLNKEELQMEGSVRKMKFSVSFLRNKKMALVKLE